MERVVGMGKEIIKQPVSDAQKESQSPKKGGVLTFLERAELEDKFSRMPDVGASTGMKAEAGALENLDGARMVKPEDMKEIMAAVGNVSGRLAEALEIREKAAKMTVAGLENTVAKMKKDLEHVQSLAARAGERSQKILEEKTEGGKVSEESLAESQPSQHSRIFYERMSADLYKKNVEDARFELEIFQAVLTARRGEGVG